MEDNFVCHAYVAMDCVKQYNSCYRCVCYGKCGACQYGIFPHDVDGSGVVDEDYKTYCVNCQWNPINNK